MHPTSRAERVEVKGRGSPTLSKRSIPPDHAIQTCSWIHTLMADKSMPEFYHFAVYLNKGSILSEVGGQM